MSTAVVKRAESPGGNGQIQRHQGEGPGKTLANLLESRREAMAMVLPKHLTADRMIKVALVAANKTPALLSCTPESVLQSVMGAAQLGLDCGGALGHAYLVPYGNQCQLILGYRGMIDLARRSGQIQSIEARVVWENDEFDVSYAIDGVQLRHRPALDKEPGDLRLVYAVAVLKDGGVQFELMSRAQIDAVKRRSRSGNSGPWMTDYPEMARKTVVKRLFKYLPVSIEIAEATEADSRADFGDTIDLQQVRAEPTAGDLNRRLANPQRPALDAPAPTPEPKVDTATGEVVDEAAAPATAAEPEPPADQQADSPGPFGDDVLAAAARSWKEFVQCAADLAEAHGVDAEVAGGRLQGMKLTHGGARMKDANDRQVLLTLMRDGRFDWTAAK